MDYARSFGWREKHRKPKHSGHIHVAAIFAHEGAEGPAIVQTILMTGGGVLLATWDIPMFLKLMAFLSAFDRVVMLEGGYSDHPMDSGGRTKYGVTEAVARKHGYRGRIEDMTLDFARMVYRQDYWDGMRLDCIKTESNGLAEKLFDAGVNVGTHRASEWLQRALNVYNQGGSIYADIHVDGQIGPQTIAALQAFLRRRGHEGMRVLLKTINALQGAFYITLAERRQKDEAFVYGWIRTRIQ